MNSSLFLKNLEKRFCNLTYKKRLRQTYQKFTATIIGKIYRRKFIDYRYRFKKLRFINYCYRPDFFKIIDYRFLLIRKRQVRNQIYHVLVRNRKSAKMFLYVLIRNRKTVTLSI